MMDLVKKQLFYIICGVVAIGGIALGFVGFGATSKVEDKLREASQLYSELETLSRAPKKPNDKFIKQEEERIARIQNQEKKMRDLFSTMKPHTPLLPDMFPDPEYTTQQQFSKEYMAAIQRLAGELNSGTPPTEADILLERELLKGKSGSEQGWGMDEDEKKAEQEEREKTEAETGDHYPSGLIKSFAAKKDPAVIASVKRAGQIYCYLSPDAFDVDPEMMVGDSPVPPTEYECWFAQVSLWIQQDVVSNIARVNDTRAKELREQDIRPCVTNLPIKDLLSIRVSNTGIETGPYLLPNQTGESSSGGMSSSSSFGLFNPAGGEEPAEVSTDPSVSFTNNLSTQDYEVIRFTVKMAVDSRDLPYIISELTKGSLTTLYHCSYEVIPPNLEMQGKLYGPEPVISVVLDFETFMLTSLYIDIIPQYVLDKLQKQRPDKEPENNNG